MSDLLDSRRLHSCLACQDLTCRQQALGLMPVTINGRHNAPEDLLTFNGIEASRHIHVMMAILMYL